MNARLSDVMDAINALSKWAFEIAKDKGFHDEEVPISQALMLINTELCECYEATRNGKDFGQIDYKELFALEEGKTEEFIPTFEKRYKDSPEDELADAVIRIFDLAGQLNINLGLAILSKMTYNLQRPHKHGKRF